MILCLHPDGQTGKCELNNEPPGKSEDNYGANVRAGFRIQPKKEEGEMGKLKYSAMFLVFLTLGCAGLQTEREKMALFDKTSRAYDLAIRWAQYEDAFAFKKSSGPDDELPDIEDYRQVRVTALKVKQTIIDKESLSKVLRIVDIQYYRMNNVIVKNLQNQQKWEYNEGEDRWYLVSELPNFE
jgi:hypothetical protein